MARRSSDWGHVPATFADTWFWNGTDWSPVVTATSPPARLAGGFAYDAAQRTMVLFGGESPMSQDTWLFAGTTWAPDTTAPAPFIRTGVAMAYDQRRARTVLFGGTAGAVFDGDTWEYGTPPLATWRAYGSGCAGAAGMPEFGPVADARPLLGRALPIEVLHVGTAGAAIALLGLANGNWNGTPLPLRLDGLGMPGCALLVRPDLALVASVTNGRATWSFALPNAPALVGTALYGQAVVADGSANAAGFAWSNAGAGVAGTF